MDQVVLWAGFGAGCSVLLGVVASSVIRDDTLPDQSVAVAADRVLYNYLEGGWLVSGCAVLLNR
jgi:hypothetical protein